MAKENLNTEIKKRAEKLAFLLYIKSYKAYNE